MRPEERDPGYVWDMLDAARSVREFTTGVTHDEYLGDRKLQLAVERALEIIGEAARLVSPTFKANHAENPWKEIISFLLRQLSDSGVRLSLAQTTVPRPHPRVENCYLQGSTSSISRRARAFASASSDIVMYFRAILGPLPVLRGRVKAAVFAIGYRPANSTNPLSLARTAFSFDVILRLTAFAIASRS
jgi:hypothetical protein